MCPPLLSRSATSASVWAVEVAVAAGNGPGWSPPELRRAERERSFETGRLPTPEAHVDMDGIGLVDGDVFDEQADHALALSLRSRRIGPQGGKITGESTDLRLLLVAQRGSCCVARPVVFVLRAGELAKSVVPVRFQGVGCQGRR